MVGTHLLNGVRSQKAEVMVDLMHLTLHEYLLNEYLCSERGILLR
jgi:hypothetical protein